MMGLVVKTAWMLLLPLAATPAEPCETDLCWSASPVLCIASVQGERCEAELKVVWSSPEPVDLCLYLADEALSCWQQQQQGQWSSHLIWPEQASLTLRDTDKVYLDEMLKTVSRQPKRRRRLVAPWSVF
ncbi:DUF3019 domain-containing protein [Alkalimonas sp.]|uniref:DUF3019 domain-containing protein n=1 Tax=Alkalimonas sp. TaxID=1872453 RepID=UPI00263AA983|nr:DUF3019 domain-containing protein [Alkalimonas sp.]MCC5827269.1 DUF3019 domain-containing protein [Alkalimonas sp.]